jgi:hypothetical protein
MIEKYYKNYENEFEKNLLFIQIRKNFVRSKIFLPFSHELLSLLKEILFLLIVRSLQ